MKCPNCETVLKIAERYTVEIDYCPSCRGVWLDKGELDKIISLSSQQNPAFSKSDDADDDDDDRGFEQKSRSHEPYKDGKGQYGQKSKKRSFLSDLFDFG